MLLAESENLTNSVVTVINGSDTKNSSHINIADTSDNWADKTASLAYRPNDLVKLTACNMNNLAHNSSDLAHRTALQTSFTTFTTYRTLLGVWCSKQGLESCHCPSFLSLAVCVNARIQ